MSTAAGSVFVVIPVFNSVGGSVPRNAGCVAMAKDARAQVQDGIVRLILAVFALLEQYFTRCGSRVGVQRIGAEHEKI